MFQNIINFFNHPFFMIIGGFGTLIIIIGFIAKIVYWFFGITPVLFRLGNSLWNRKIAIFGGLEVFYSLKNILIDSKIFSEDNIIHIENGSFEKSKNKTIFIVDWDSCGNKIEEIFQLRKDTEVPVVIYAKPASISNDKMSDIANRQNTIVVNFKGRLLNDVLTSIITTK